MRRKLADYGYSGKVHPVTGEKGDLIQEFLHSHLAGLKAPLSGKGKKFTDNFAAPLDLADGKVKPLFEVGQVFRAGSDDPLGF